MQSARCVADNSRSPVWSDSATNHATFPSEGGYLFPAFQVPEPQRSITRGRNSPEQVRHERHGPDAVRMAFERAQRFAGFQVPEPQRSVTRRRKLPGAHRA